MAAKPVYSYFKEKVTVQHESLKGRKKIPSKILGLQTIGFTPLRGKYFCINSDSALAKC